MLYQQAISAVVLGCVLVACGSATDSTSGQSPDQASASPAPTITVLDQEMAGERYMNVICPANEATDRWSLLASDVALGSAWSPEYRKEMKQLAAAYSKAARQLVDPNYEWPDTAAPSIERVAEQFYGDSAAVTRATKEDVVTEVDFSTSTKSADRVRLRLGLPPAGTGCKKYVG